jgi:hypothetical protein
MTFTEYMLDNTPINVRPDCPQCTWRALNQRSRDTIWCPRCQHVERAVVQFKISPKA